MWFSSGLGSISLMILLNDLGGVFQTKWAYDSVIL